MKYLKEYKLYEKMEENSPSESDSIFNRKCTEIVNMLDSYGDELKDHISHNLVPLEDTILGFKFHIEKKLRSSIPFIYCNIDTDNYDSAIIHTKDTIDEFLEELKIFCDKMSKIFNVKVHIIGYGRKQFNIQGDIDTVIHKFNEKESDNPPTTIEIYEIDIELK